MTWSHDGVTGFRSHDGVTGFKNKLSASCRLCLSQNVMRYSYFPNEECKATKVAMLVPPFVPPALGNFNCLNLCFLLMK